MMAGGQIVIAEALSWLGTPYRHQGDRKGVGCDCLGLVRGVWHAVYGEDAEHPGSYSPGWVGQGAGEQLLDSLRRHFLEKPLADAGPGDVLAFRWRPHLPVRHLGIQVEPDAIVHAYEGAGAVVMSTLVPQWRRRIAAVFAFPSP
jgi:NlpC/P60 family putative phage cell wall peptidase